MKLTRTSSVWFEQHLSNNPDVEMSIDFRCNGPTSISVWEYARRAYTITYAPKEHTNATC